MTKQKHIGLELAKRLHSAGFNGESEFTWLFDRYLDKFITLKSNACVIENEKIKHYPAYTYQQILIDHARELFGEGTEYADRFEFISKDDEGLIEQYEFISREILQMLQADNPDYEAVDDYIWENYKGNK